MTTAVSTRSPGTLNPTRQQLDELDALLQRMLELPVNKLEELEQSAVEEEPAEEPLPAANRTERPPVLIRWSSAPPPDESNLLPQPEPQPTAPVSSYMVIETASPRPLPPASGFEPRPSALAPRLVPVTPPQSEKEEPEAVAPIVPAPTRETPLPPTDGDAWVPLRSTWQPSAQTWQPLAESWHQAHGGSPIPEAMPSPLPSPRLEPAPQPADASQTASESPIRVTPPPTEVASVSSAPNPTPAAEPRLSLSAEDAPATVPSLLLPLLWFNQGFDACLAPLGAPARWVCGSRGRQVLGFIGLTCLAAAAAIAVSAGMGWTW